MLELLMAMVMLNVGILAVVAAGRVVGYSTDAAILAELEFRRAAIVGDGGAAVAFRAALPDAAHFSRKGIWPPDVSDADLIVNATSGNDAIKINGDSSAVAVSSISGTRAASVFAALALVVVGSLAAFGVLPQCLGADAVDRRARADANRRPHAVGPASHGRNRTRPQPHPASTQFPANGGLRGHSC